MSEDPKSESSPDDPSLHFALPYDVALALTSNTFPGPVFHYTDQAGFLGIVRDKALWASDLRYLNDSREYLVGFERISAELTAMTVGDKDLATIVDEALSLATIETAMGVSVASFSLAQDSLSQWRAYGSGSGGICIGFDSVKLAESILRTGSYIGAVRYSQAEQSDVVGKVCAEIVGDARNVVAGKTHPKRFASRCTLSVQLACALMKHEKFAEEQEWRMVVWSQLPPFCKADVRPGKSTLIPYISVHLDVVYNHAARDMEFSNELPLETVWIGPTPHPTLAVRGAESALDMVGETATVKVSEVPFRNW